MNPNSTDFSKLTVKFLTDYLPFQRGFTNNTLLSYRDCFKLLLRFLVEDKKVDLATFQLKDLTKELVIEFLSHYRNNGASPRAANQRLAAIKSFCEYASTENPDCLSSLLGVRSIKSRKSHGRTIQYLSVEQTTKLLDAPDPRSRTGLRHKVILSLMYDTGCRVQELCDLTVEDLRLGLNPATVRLHGKGQKDRTVYLSKKAVELFSLFKKRFHARSLGTDPFFRGRSGGKLTRQGVTHIVKKYGEIVSQGDPNFPASIHCHMLRHSKAMHMLQAGINIVVIRDFLGHEDVSTTMVYARADNRTKEEAIGKLAPQLLAVCPQEDPIEDGDLMKFLDNLKLRTCKVH